VPGRALIVVDVQNDFLPGGALAVPCGDEVIEVANRIAPLFETVVATQDWHPANHVSFAANHPGRAPGDTIEINGQEQKLWPVHCVQGTRGAALARQLHLGQHVHGIHKGTAQDIDSYSAFFDNACQHATGLEAFLRSAGVRDLYVLGLATEYCVAATVRDALELGFSVSVVVDGCRGIDVHRGDAAAALEKLRERGARLIDSRDLPDLLTGDPD
jgi:nicotinamidase/pyrazinamidase